MAILPLVNSVRYMVLSIVFGLVFSIVLRCLMGVAFIAFTGLITTVQAKQALQLSVQTDPAKPAFGQVEVVGVDNELLSVMKQSKVENASWKDRVAIHISSSFEPIEVASLPSVAGDYEVVDNRVRFTPRFAPMLGLVYHIQVRLAGYLPLEKTVQLGTLVSANNELTLVSSIYPSSDTIPENTLRFYVHFSQPMQRGQVREKIRLLDEQGQVVNQAFILGPMGELWDREQRRLTLLLDPGRIKQGVRPNRALGLALASGKQRTLVIDADFKDANGQRLNKEFRQAYSIGNAIRQAIALAQWQINSPRTGTREPLEVQFTRSLDQAMLSHAISVRSSDGNPIIGHIQLTANESLWSFTPEHPWEPSLHYLSVAPELEDVAGNNLLGPLDVKLTTPIVGSTMQATPNTVEISFQPQIVH